MLLGSSIAISYGAFVTKIDISIKKPEKKETLPPPTPTPSTTTPIEEELPNIPEEEGWE
ncbi:MAG: hypothetical protein N2053_06145 [Chitinispirillaceae bacterium]|nr:hypothetical protein [Chitinispirillaceae bacterium]